jgi:hypothetical protein
MFNLKIKQHQVTLYLLYFIIFKLVQIYIDDIFNYLIFL